MRSSMIMRRQHTRQHTSYSNHITCEHPLNYQSGYCRKQLSGVGEALSFCLCLLPQLVAPQQWGYVDVVQHMERLRCAPLEATEIHHLEEDMLLEAPAPPVTAGCVRLQEVEAQLVSLFLPQPDPLLQVSIPPGKHQFDALPNQLLVEVLLWLQARTFADPPVDRVLEATECLHYHPVTHKNHCGLAAEGTPLLCFREAEPAKMQVSAWSSVQQGSNGCELT
jgi:hypothetical protein